MSRVWRTETCSRGGVSGREAYSTSYQSYTLKQAGEVMNKIRKAEIDAGQPKRKINPISVYLLDELVRMFFVKYAHKGETLEQIIIRDTNEK